MSAEFHDCDQVIEHIYAFQDNELSLEEADLIRHHLMACEPCLDQFQVEDAMRLLIRRCCLGERAPEQLHMRIRATYTQTVIVTGPDLD